MAPRAVESPAARDLPACSDHQVKAIIGATNELRLPLKTSAANIGASRQARISAGHLPLRQTQSAVANMSKALHNHQSHIASQSGAKASGRQITATRGGEPSATEPGGQMIVGRSPGASE